MKKKLFLNYPYLILSIITLFCFVILLYLFQNDSFGRPFFLTILLLLLTWLIVVIDRLFHIHFPRLIYYVYFMILVLTIGIGDLFNLYKYISWYDIIVHFILGIGFSIFGIYIIIRMDNIGYLKFSILLTYSVFFVGLSSNIYMILEYIMKSIFYSNVQAIEIIKNSVFTLLGGFIFSILLIIDNYYYNNKYIEMLVKKLS